MGAAASRPPFHLFLSKSGDDFSRYAAHDTRADGTGHAQDGPARPPLFTDFLGRSFRARNMHNGAVRVGSDGAQLFTRQYCAKHSRPVRLSISAPRVCQRSPGMSRMMPACRRVLSMSYGGRHARLALFRLRLARLSTAGGSAAISRCMPITNTHDMAWLFRPLFHDDITTLSADTAISKHVASPAFRSPFATFAGRPCRISRVAASTSNMLYRRRHGRFIAMARIRRFAMRFRQAFRHGHAASKHDASRFLSHASCRAALVVVLPS